MQRLLSNEKLSNSSIWGPTGSNIKSEQRGVTSILSSNVSIDITITAVNINNTKVKCSFETTNGSNPNDIAISIELINSTTIRLRRGNTSGFASSNIAWEVIEYNNVKSKQTGIKTLVGATEETVTVASVDVSKSELTYSFTHNNASGSPDAMATLGRISNATTIAFQNAQTAPTIYWQLLEFN